MKTGETIGVIAKEKGVNLRQLAIKADIPYNTIYAIVQRKSDRIERETLQRIAIALDVPVWELMGYDGSILVKAPTGSQDNPSAESLDSFTATLENAEDKIKWALLQLTDDGKNKVADYAMDLMKIPEYRRQDIPTEESK